MNENEMKKLFKERWNELFPGKRLLAIHLNGFSHSAFYDEKNINDKVTDYKIVQYSGCMSTAELIRYNMNDDNAVKLFEGFPNYVYQGNAVEIVYVKP